MAAIPHSFESRKQKILKDLSVPDDEYTDSSPKGSVDVGIRDLIHNINELPGLVTTSSCAGRISIYLEGNKAAVPARSETVLNRSGNGDEGQPRQFAATGGKGGGGKWLFVSHDPVESDRSFHELFEIAPGDGKPRIDEMRGVQLVRFHFEPMILHIMAASLKHAQPVLAAASSAGFRESGLQSLRNLDDEGTSPIVAVRSSGLALESIIGIREPHSDGDIARSLVSEEYLRMLVAVANERFKVNIERVARFRAKLMELCSPQAAPGKKEGWEDPDSRRERKRMEGLQRKKELEGTKHNQNEKATHDTDDEECYGLPEG
ncbi:hypothetical protein FQN54_002332 [Arachnomyces sp. PD_36]|nr:hypothetical protein FQN54_002332 [Arachnomyces sp. PD_36]